jgi:hypothetical protein
MDASTPSIALGHLLAALEYGTAKEDRAFTDKILAHFALPRASKGELVDLIMVSPGFEPFFLATVSEARPFALMLKEVYGLLSRLGTTAKRRATLIRVSTEGAHLAFDFDLEAFPREVMRYIEEIDAALEVLQIEFGSIDERTAKFSWYTSQTYKLWQAISPKWDGDFYDDGFHAALSFAGSILNRASAESKARAEALVAPTIDRLRALTDTLRWPELGVSQREIDVSGQSFINGQRESLRVVAYPPLTSRLDRAPTIGYFRHLLSEDDGAGAPSLSGPVDEMLWDRLSRTIIGTSVTVDLWQRRVERKDPRKWLEAKLAKPLEHVTAEEYLSFLEPLVNQYAARLSSLLRVVDREVVPQLREALIEFFRLPFWKDRWFLYELWTLCRILTLSGSRWPIALEGVERRADGSVEWKLPGGLASRPVALIGAGQQVECWTQRKTLHPVTGEGLEPDLRITRSKADRPDIFVVENKDRRKPRTGDMGEILQRYVTGTQARCVCLVNYEQFTGPTHNLPRSVPGRQVLILSHFRPTQEAPDFRLRLMQILEEELGSPAPPQKAEPLQAEFLEVALKWDHAPGDLDLHAWVERSDGSYHLFYLNQGSLDGPPRALLSNDATQALGRETLKLQTEGLVRATVAVHRFSPGVLGAAAASVEIRGGANGPHRLELMTDESHQWWHVAEIDGADLSVTILNAVAAAPPVSS